MDSAPAFDVHHLVAIAQTLGDTAQGLTGSQIGILLRDTEIPDVSPDAPPWQRLANAFVALQNKLGSSACIIRFLKRAMDPVQYTSAPRTFARRRNQLNFALSPCGVVIGEDGRIEQGIREDRTSVPIDPKADLVRRL